MSLFEGEAIRVGSFVRLRKGTVITLPPVGEDGEVTATHELRSEITVLVDRIDGDRMFWRAEWHSAAERSAPLAAAALTFLTERGP